VFLDAHHLHLSLIFVGELMTLFLEAHHSGKLQPLRQILD